MESLYPLLFLLYINDLKIPGDDSCLLLFADDTTLLLRSRDSNSLQSIAQDNLHFIDSWLRANQLACNVSKTVYMTFSLNPSVRSFSFNLFLNNQPLKKVFSTRFLGIMIDNNLNWKEHINVISSKVSKCIGIIYKLNKILPYKTLLLLYKSLILPHFSYCHVVWGNAAACRLQRLIVLQKRALRAIHKTSYRSHTEPLFIESKIIPFPKLFSYHASIFLFKLQHDLFPATFTRSFSLPTSRQTANTRRQTLPYISTTKFRTTFGQRCLLNSITKLFNEFILPLGIFNFNLYEMKQNLKTILI